MTIGDRIKQRRIELNLSQDEVAKKVGYKSRSSIQKIESARNLPIDKVESMARALECSPAFLMGWEDTEFTDQFVNLQSLTDAEVELLDRYNHAPAQLRTMVDYILKSVEQGIEFLDLPNDKDK